MVYYNGNTYQTCITSFDFEAKAETISMNIDLKDRGQAM